MNFGKAIEALQSGQRVARAGWNGKGMFIIEAGGYSIHKDQLRPNSPITKEFLESRGCDEMFIQKHFDMWTAQNQYQTGWLASQSDMQATDWEIVQ
jgi:hypothetical protein